jgi:hypothetical protein
MIDPRLATRGERHRTASGAAPGNGATPRGDQLPFMMADCGSIGPSSRSMFMSPPRVALSVTSPVIESQR